MKRLLHILLNLLLWSALIAYLVVAARYCSRREKEQLCRGIRVEIKDSVDHPFITSGMVNAWFAAEQIKIRKEPLRSLNTMQIREFIERRGFVKSARVYTSMDGMLNIEITQRTPIARINTANGYDFYVTDDNYVLPTQRYAVVYVPIVTGVINLPFSKEYVGPIKNNRNKEQKKEAENEVFLFKLINFVKFIANDPFWNAQIVQIQVRTEEQVGGEASSEGSVREPKVVLVPRMGDQIVVLGTLDQFPEKLEKLMTFYKNGLAYEGWERYTSINLQYDGQVVCR